MKTMIRERGKGVFWRSLMAVWLTASVAVGAMEIKNNTQAVDQMGKQRMLSMRMLKDYVMMGMGNTYGDPKKDLEKTSAEFDEALKALKGYIKEGEIKEKVVELEKEWAKVRKVLEKKPEKSRAKEYLKMMVHLREVANDATNMLAKKDGDGKGHQVLNMSGRLRAVSQALAAVYMLKTWQMEGADEALKVPMKRFRGSMDYLLKAPETGPEMKKILDRLEKTYLFFQVMNESGTFTPSLVAKKTDRMLRDASQLTRLYAEKLN